MALNFRLGLALTSPFGKLFPTGGANPVPPNAVRNSSGGYVLNASGGYVLNRSA